MEHDETHSFQYPLLDPVNKLVKDHFMARVAPPDQYIGICKVLRCDENMPRGNVPIILGVVHVVGIGIKPIVKLGKCTA